MRYTMKPKREGYGEFSVAATDAGAALKIAAELIKQGYEVTVIGNLDGVVYELAELKRLSLVADTRPSTQS